MKICYICNEYPEGPHGGVGTMTKLLSEELAAKGNSVKVIGVYDSGYPSSDYKIQNGVEVTRIKVNSKNRLAVFYGHWIMARKIKSWIKNDLVDIIECPDSYGLFSLFAPFNRPLVLRANGNNTYFSSILKIPLKKNTAFYERNLYKKAFAYCAVSAFTANKIKMLFNLEDSITVIYNAVAIQQDEYKFPENYKELSVLPNPIVFSGTLTPKKGIYQLVRAMIIMLEKGIEVTLFINGKDTVNIKSGKLVKSELLEMIPQELMKHFVFNGHITREELFYQYKHAKAAIFPSFAEAFALAPMEAMALGIPAIFSSECSGGELIINNEDGFLIDPSSEESISQVIEYIIQNPAIAKQIGQKGKEKIVHYFSKETMATKSIAFYEKTQNAFSAKQLHIKN